MRQNAEHNWVALLADRRELGIEALAHRSGVTESALRDVLQGAAPSPELLRQLAPALGLHTADLFVMAGTAVPDDLAPADAQAGTYAARLAERAMGLTPDKRRELRGLVASLPQEVPRQPPPRPPAHQQYPEGPGAVPLRLLRNRNLGWSATARTFLSLTGRYWSASTYGMVGHGRKPLTPDLLVDFSTVLGIPPGDLSALTGVALPDDCPTPPPAARDVAELVWDVRRLTAPQLQQVCGVAQSMQE